MRGPCTLQLLAACVHSRHRPPWLHGLARQRPFSRPPQVPPGRVSYCCSLHAGAKASDDHPWCRGLMLQPRSFPTVLAALHHPASPKARNAKTASRRQLHPFMYQVPYCPRPYSRGRHAHMLTSCLHYQHLVLATPSSPVHLPPLLLRNPNLPSQSPLTHRGTASHAHRQAHTIQNHHVTASLVCQSYAPEEASTQVDIHPW